jgi:hypothetical protein
MDAKLCKSKPVGAVSYSAPGNTGRCIAQDRQTKGRLRGCGNQPEQYERIKATILWARYAWVKSASLLRHAQEKATNKEAAGTGASIGTNSQDQETTAATT